MKNQGKVNLTADQGESNETQDINGTMCYHINGIYDRSMHLWYLCG